MQISNKGKKYTYCNLSLLKDSHLHTLHMRFK